MRKSDHRLDRYIQRQITRRSQTRSGFESGRLRRPPEHKGDLNMGPFLAARGLRAGTTFAGP